MGGLKAVDPLDRTRPVANRDAVSGFSCRGGGCGKLSRDSEKGYVSK